MSWGGETSVVRSVIFISLLAVVVVAVSCPPKGVKRSTDDAVGPTSTVSTSTPVPTPLSIAAAPLSSLGMTDQVADQNFARMNVLLDNAVPGPPQDVHCELSMARQGAIGSMANNLVAIDGPGELEEAYKHPADIKVVRLIAYCSTYPNLTSLATATYNGCAAAGRSAVVAAQYLSSNRAPPEARLWLHEYGHVRWLDHTHASTVSDLMNGDMTTGERINQHVCDKLRGVSP